MKKIFEPEIRDLQVAELEPTGDPDRRPEGWGRPPSALSWHRQSHSPGSIAADAQGQTVGAPLGWAARRDKYANCAVKPEASVETDGMGDNRRKSHALHTRARDLPRAKPRPGTTDITSPYLPGVGEVGWIRTSLYSANDPAEWRPCVVVGTPSTPHGYISIATRTSDPGVDGVVQQADRNLELGKDGVYSDLHVVVQRDWTSHNVRYSGVLAEPLLAEVLAWFE